ncbi:MAG TPA: carboxypeptidase-like regulatory domain-containing protein, partial [Cyclobacteriaceae bacterium]|nr:carboxypeptidase-like regulatory domain-containing protein [Cyclobacteriaceae bacterium]
MRFFILFVCLLCCQLTFAQQHQQVTGRVEDLATRTVLTGASVMLVRDTVTVGTTTGESGVFVFDHVFPGRYILKVSFTGYETVQQELLVIS